MSNNSITSVLTKSKSKGTARLILIILADYANEEGVAYPSANTIAGKANTSRRNVIKSLSKLEDAGELTRVGLYKRGVIKYKITVVTSELPDTYEHKDTCEQNNSTCEPEFTTTCEPEFPQTLNEPSSNPQYMDGKRKNGTKLSEDWKPTEKDIQFAKDKGWTNARIENEAANFVEHFTNGNGRKYARVDWSKSWQTWVRKDYGGNKQPEVWDGMRPRNNANAWEEQERLHRSLANK